MKLLVDFREQPGSVPAAWNDTQDREIHSSFLRAREAQPDWASTRLRDRLRILRNFRDRLASCAEILARDLAESSGRPAAEVLAAQILPLAEACRFLERNSASILRSRRLGRFGAPAWLTGVETEIVREPHGVVLVIGASNYPLFLPGVHTLQALVAGNAVLLKPGEGGSVAAERFMALLIHSGLNPALIQLLPETSEAGRRSLVEDIDKVVFTGSAATGQAVLSQLAYRTVPATLELSGCDAVFVREDADLDLVVRALAFGLRWNGGATCIGPRRVFVRRAMAERLERALIAACDAMEPVVLNPSVTAQVVPLVEAALRDGAALLRGILPREGTSSGPVVLSGVRPPMAILRSDLLGPVLSIVAVDSEREALDVNALCPFALGASIFGRDVSAARAFGRTVRAGVVTINDIIVPTADPRVPFGGRGRSGFGTTRGAEGLLEMSLPKAISTNRSRRRPHYEALRAGHERLFAHYLGMVHAACWITRLGHARRLFRTVLRDGIRPLPIPEASRSGLLPLRTAVRSTSCKSV